MGNITFFIPAYNCAATIAESVDSIMETNFKDGDELIIVNDCSTDDTFKILSKLKQIYPFIKVINHKINEGGGAARNTCIKNSSNELLFCLDADNVLEKNSILPLKNELILKCADIASFQEMRYFNTENKWETKYIWKFLPETSLADFMADHKNPGSSGNYLFTKISWQKANEYPEFAGGLDTWGFCFRQLAAGCKLVSLPGSYYFHRFGTNSYYIREMNQRNMSLVAFQIVFPFRNLIEPADFEYITGEDNKYNWFDNFDSRQIRLVGCKPGSKAVSITVLQSHSVHGMVNRIYSKIKNAFRFA